MTTTARAPLERTGLTVADYHRLGETGILGTHERLELIEGEIVEMAPIGSSHAGRVKRLNRLLTQAVGGRALVAVQDPIVLDQCSEPEPDIALLRPRADFYTDSHPQPHDVLLLIEVAETSLGFDLEIKVPLYARHAIPEVWVVDITHRRIQRFADPAGGIYRTCETIDVRLRTPLPGLAGCTLNLADLL